MIKILILALMVLSMAACSSSDDVGRSVFWDNDGDVRGADARADITERDFAKLVSMNEAVVVVEITDIQQTERLGRLPVTVTAEDPSDQPMLDRNNAEMADLPTSTTYLAKVQEWIKGTGGDEINISASGGSFSDGTLDFVDGFFLLEPGRRYLLLLSKNQDGVYSCCWSRAGFELTEGVKVLNHPDTRDLEHFEQMSVEEFEAYVAGLVSSGMDSSN